MSIQYCSGYDSVGERSVSRDVYHGVQPLRAVEDLPITELAVHPEQINSIAEVKETSIIINPETGLPDKRAVDAIVRAYDGIVAGRLHETFAADPIRGDVGTSLNMNVNEAIANRTIELLGGEEGDYALVNPNDYVNYGQSTSDMSPSAGKLAVLKLPTRVQIQLERSSEALEVRAGEFDDVFKVDRTQIQDVVPICLGQEFRVYSWVVRRGVTRFERVKDEMRRLNMGDTATGIGTNANEWYLRRIIPNLSKVTGLELVQVSDFVDAIQNLNGLAAMSGAAKACIVGLSKMFNDLRLMSPGPRHGFSEISLSPRQNGSSIMPGKVGPVIPEVVDQMAFSIIGSDITVTITTEVGQLKLNVFESIIFYNLIQSAKTLTYAVHTFMDSCVTGITANRGRRRNMVEHGAGVITALCPHVGYEGAVEVARRVVEAGTPVWWFILEEDLLDEAALDKILDPYSITEPNISGKELPGG